MAMYCIEVDPLVFKFVSLFCEHPRAELLYDVDKIMYICQICIYGSSMFISKCKMPISPLSYMQHNLHRCSKAMSTIPDPKAKFNFELDPEFEARLSKGIKGKRHPGTLQMGTVSLPESLVTAASTVLSKFSTKTLERDSSNLNIYLWARQPPLEKRELQQKLRDVSAEIIEKESIDPMSPDVPEHVKERLLKYREREIKKRMGAEMGHWKALSYNDYRSAVYVMARMAPDYAALRRILLEIKKRDPAFSPESMLDFGSGVGTGVWAVDETWPNVCKEVMCVDISSSMNTVAETLLRSGDPDKPLPKRPGGMFFRQFLPTSDRLKYDLVIVSRSLFELPNLTSRLKTIDILWRKTTGYIVIVEAGSNAGYGLIQEARDYILDLSRKGTANQVERIQGHVFSPCPHDSFCPRFFDGTNKPCRFQVSYKPLSLTKEKLPERDLFSYVVIKNGNRNSVDLSGNEWPRVVRPVLCRKGHVICRTCTKYGNLQEFTVTKQRHDSKCFQVAKATHWGDLFPIRSPDPKASDSIDSEYIEERVGADVM